LRETVQLL